MAGVSSRENNPCVSLYRTHRIPSFLCVCCVFSFAYRASINNIRPRLTRERAMLFIPHAPFHPSKYKFVRQCKATEQGRNLMILRPGFEYPCSSSRPMSYSTAKLPNDKAICCWLRTSCVVCVLCVCVCVCCVDMCMRALSGALNGASTHRSANHRE